MVAFRVLIGPHQTRQGRAQLGGPVLPGFLRWNSRIASLAFLISVAKFQIGLWPPAYLTRYSSRWPTFLKSSIPSTIHSSYRVPSSSLTTNGRCSDSSSLMASWAGNASFHGLTRSIAIIRCIFQPWGKSKVTFPPPHDLTVNGALNLLSSFRLGRLETFRFRMLNQTLSPGL